MHALLLTAGPAPDLTEYQTSRDEKGGAAFVSHLKKKKERDPRCHISHEANSLLVLCSPALLNICTFLQTWEERFELFLMDFTHKISRLQSAYVARWQQESVLCKIGSVEGIALGHI